MFEHKKSLIQISQHLVSACKAGKSRGRAPGQASDYALRAPNPLDNSAMTRCFIKISWPPNQSGPQVFCPSCPPPLSPALSACINDVENAVNLDAEKFHKRLMANERSLNVAKTEFQLSGTKRNLKNDLA